MGRKCQMVMGPAGAGKTSYCSTLIAHMEAGKRKGFVLNLDPAAENFEHEVDVDIRDLITVGDASEELGYGPNGGLVYCLEYLMENIDWLDEALAVDTADDDYWIIDCPGQIELYTHFPVMRNLVNHLQSVGFTVCGVYCVEAPFVTDQFKFFSACLTAMSAMIQLEIPHVNVLTKLDLIKDHIDPARLERFLWSDSSLMDEWIVGEGRNASSKWKGLNQAVMQLIESYGMVSFLPLNVTEEHSIDALLLQIDHAVQYGEDLEPIEPNELEIDDH